MYSYLNTAAFLQIGQVCHRAHSVPANGQAQVRWVPSPFCLERSNVADGECRAMYGV